MSSTKQEGGVAVQELERALSTLKPFESPKQSLGVLDAKAAASLIEAASDVALVIDQSGVICDVAFGSDELAGEGYRKWVGQPWVDTVVLDSRPKIELLLKDARSGARKWRQVNHPSANGADVPVTYSAVQIGTTDRIIAFGRDLRAIGAIQQRLVAAQQSMERDYWQLRHLETRYRLLFQMSTEAVLIVDVPTGKILEANPAAGRLLGENSKRVVGRTFPDGFDAESAAAIEALLVSVRVVGRGEDVHVRMAGNNRQEFLVSASLVKQDNSSLYLVRLTSLSADGNQAMLPTGKSMLLKVVESVPDGMVVTDLDGHVLVANRAFVDLAHLASEDQARNESLDRWLGRPGVDLNVLIANLRQHGSVRLYATTLRSEHGAVAEVEISAVAVPGDHPCLGFTIRHVGQRLNADLQFGKRLPRSVEQMTELVGRVSLKDLVRESTDLIERLCIEAALELTHDNRASAAEMLGLSRQGLYLKLRRYGFGDLASEPEN